MNSFSRATETLAAVAKDLGVPIAIVGGLAGIHHGALVTTLDIDIVVPKDKMDVFLAAAGNHGLVVKKRSLSGWHQLVYRGADGEVDIGVIPEGANSPRDPGFAPPNPGPSELGVEQGLGYASFAGWAAMKLVANRDKDRYHLVEALKKATPQQIGEAVIRVRKMHASYLKELERLLRAAEEEAHENW